MAFVEHNSMSTQSSVNRRSETKKRNRTLAKQQQIAESIDSIANEILGKAQESVSAIEELKSAMDQIAAASEQNAGASEQGLSVVTELNSSIQKTMRELNESVAIASSTKVSVEESGDKIIETAKRIATRK